MPRRTKKARLINNPFYLISAMLMLIASIPINFTHGISENAQFIKEMVVYEFIIYEGLLFAGFFLLWTQVKNYADAQILLCLCLLFAFDPTFTYFKFCIDTPDSAVYLSAMNVFLMGVKLFLCYVALRREQPNLLFMSAASILYAVCMAIFFAPAILIGTRGAFGQEVLFYMWSLVCVPLLFTGGRWCSKEFWLKSDTINMSLAYRFGKIIAPLIMLLTIGHLLATHFVYHAAFYFSCLQIPLVMLLWKWSLADMPLSRLILLLAKFQIVLIILFIWADQVMLAGKSGDWYCITPFRLSCFLLATMHIHLAIKTKRFELCLISIFYFICLLGADWLSLGRLMNGYMPETAMGWGGIGIALAFVVAGLGFYKSITDGNAGTEPET